MALLKKLPVVGLALIIAGGIYYFVEVDPERRARAIDLATADARAAFERGDCRTAVARYADAREWSRDTLSTADQDVAQRCETLLGTPAGGVARFLARAVDAVCAGRSPTSGDDQGRRFGPEFFAMIDTAAGGFWGGPDIQPFVPDDLRAGRVVEFRYAVCSQVEESRVLERCPYTLYSGGSPQTVYLTRANQRWAVRAVDVRTRRTVARTRFWTSNPGSCKENESLLNLKEHVVTGGLDTARFNAWLRGVTR